MLHAPCPGATGGRQILAAAEPNTGAEWCVYWNIAPDAPFAVANIDAAVLDAIQGGRIKFDMSSWHGTEHCDETNWCNTTHCRAGAAICLAGAAGLALEAKFGPERAGAMIYAVSRPDQPLPDFHATSADALADIRKSAARTAP